MPLPPGFPASPHDILDPGARWVPGEPDERMEKLPPLVQQLREQVKEWRDKDDAKATDTGAVCCTGGLRKSIGFQEYQSP